MADAPDLGSGIARCEGSSPSSPTKKKVFMAYDYIQAFTEGHSYNKLVAQYLTSHGVECSVPDLQIATNLQERNNLTLNEKDIVLDGLPNVLEVKSARRSFPWNPSEYPFNNAIVDTVSSLESKTVKPTAYVLYSRPTRAMLAVGLSSQTRWVKKRLYDKYQDIYDDFYIVSKEDLKPMSELVDYLYRLQQKNGKK